LLRSLEIISSQRAGKYPVGLPQAERDLEKSAEAENWEFEGWEFEEAGQALAILGFSKE
jgi:hypothetical protein